VISIEKIKTSKKLYPTSNTTKSMGVDTSYTTKDRRR